MKKISIFDSSLRDGAQAEGISFLVNDKIKIAVALDELGVDYIEAGNPGSNQKDLEFFKEASSLKLKNAKLVAFGSTRRSNSSVNEDASLNALLASNVEYASIFGKAWDFHVEKIINTTKEENLLMIKDSIEYLVSNGLKVFFDAEHYFDGYKNNQEYALEVIKTAYNAGASMVVLCDTNGGCFPEEIANIIKNTLSVCNIPLGIHTHDDIGCAVANSLVAVESGCSQVQGTLLGYGERCGNANLATIIGALKLKKGYDVIKGDISSLTEITRNVAEISNYNLSSQAPFVGDMAFGHKAGMHVDAVYKDPKSFEHIEPTLCGNERKFLISEVAGKSTVLAKIKKIYPELEKNNPVLNEIINNIKSLEYDGYQFEGADASFELLVHKALKNIKTYFEIINFKIIGESTSSSNESSSAMIKVKVGDIEEITAANGNGPVDALNEALRKAIGHFYPILKEVSLMDYKVRILDGKDAQTAAITRVIIESGDKKSRWQTVGCSRNIIEASFKALTDSIEYKLFKENC